MRSATPSTAARLTLCRSKALVLGSPSRPRCEGVITGDVLASPASLSGFQGPVWATTPPPTCGASPSSQQRALLAMPRAGFCLYLLLPLAWGPAAVIPPSIPYPCAHAPWPVTKLPARAAPPGSLPLAAERKAVCAGVSEATHFLERPQPDPGRAGDRVPAAAGPGATACHRRPVTGTSVPGDSPRGGAKRHRVRNGVGALGALLEWAGSPRAHPGSSPLYLGQKTTLSLCKLGAVSMATLFLTSSP